VEDSSSWFHWPSNKKPKWPDKARFFAWNAEPWGDCEKIGTTFKKSRAVNCHQVFVYHPLEKNPAARCAKPLNGLTACTDLCQKFPNAPHTTTCCKCYENGKIQDTRKCKNVEKPASSRFCDCRKERCPGVSLDTECPDPNDDTNAKCNRCKYKLFRKDLKCGGQEFNALRMDSRCAGSCGKSKQPFKDQCCVKLRSSAEDVSDTSEDVPEDSSKTTLLYKQVTCPHGEKISDRKCSTKEVSGYERILDKESCSEYKAWLQDQDIEVSHGKNIKEGWHNSNEKFPTGCSLLKKAGSDPSKESFEIYFNPRKVEKLCTARELGRCDKFKKKQGRKGKGEWERAHADIIMDS